MVNRRISADLKNCALRLWNAGWQTDDISEILRVSRASLYRWRENFENFGNVLKPPSPLRGRPRLIARAVLTGLHLLLGEHPDAYLDELVWWLAIQHDVAISKSQLHINLRQAGLTRKLLRKLAIERDEELRQQWRDMVQAEFLHDGSQLVFVDETSKNEHAYFCRYGRAPCGDRAELKDVFVRGDRYSLAAALSKDGYIAAHAVPGSFDSLAFISFIAEDVLPYMNPWPEERSVLVMDNCRIHHNDTLVNLLATAGCILLFLPPYSPDLNPIEESFSTLKQYLRRHAGTIRYEDPIDSILEACGCVNAEMAMGWFKHAGYMD